MGDSRANIGMEFKKVSFSEYTYLLNMLCRVSRKKTSRSPTFWHVISCGQPNAINHTWGWLVYPTQNGTWGWFLGFRWVYHIQNPHFGWVNITGFHRYQNKFGWENGTWHWLRFRELAPRGEATGDRNRRIWMFLMMERHWIYWTTHL
jgi:hypothetical protein